MVEKIVRVLIIGFTDYQELDRTMQKLISDSNCYLFTVLVGGKWPTKTRAEQPYLSLADEWAKKNGAPVEYNFNDDIDELLRGLLIWADYLVIKITEETPQIWKNFMMKFKQEGKHGTVVK